MWTIRQEQADAFRQHHLHKFEDEMVAHSKEFSPLICKVIGDEQVRIAVRAGVERARSYGFTNRGPIRLFIEFGYLFGSAFDTDPQYPWAEEIMLSSDDQMLRAEQLYEMALDYQDGVAGPQAENTSRALKELSVRAQQPLTFSSHDYVPGILKEMTRVFPEKAAYIGEQGLRAILGESSEEARKYRFAALRGKVLLTALMFALGHGCTYDPLYPWITQTLADERISDPSVRAERLEKKALSWLSHVLTSSSGGTKA